MPFHAGTQPLVFDPAEGEMDVENNQHPKLVFLSNAHHIPEDAADGLLPGCAQQRLGSCRNVCATKAFLHPLSQHALGIWSFLQKAFVHLTTAWFFSCNVYLAANTHHFWSGWYKKLLKIILKANFAKDWGHLYDKSGCKLNQWNWKCFPPLPWHIPPKSFKILHSRAGWNFFFRIISVHPLSSRMFEQDLRIGSVTKLLVQIWGETSESQNSLGRKGH